MSHHPVKSQIGFTLIELILAMAIFTLGLLVIVFGVISLIKVYQNGVITRNTQFAIRSSFSRIDQATQTASGFLVGTTGDPNYYYICARGAGKAYYVNPADFRLMEADWSGNNLASCGSGTSNDHPITATNVKVIQLVGQTGPLAGEARCGGMFCDVRVTIRVTGTNSSVTGAGYCDPNLPLFQLCTVTAASTTLNSRGALQ
jgi:prepilin-type N-terminal cleavage/methylation domain-containing protein